MSSLKGSYQYSVDNKGRINIPSKLRKMLSDDIKDNFIITRGFDKCLYVYPLDEWAKVEQELRKLSNYNPDHRLFSRTILDIASDVQLDSQARITIPAELRQYAGIDSEVIIIGTLDKIELWNPQIYSEYKNNQSETYESVAAKVMSTVSDNAK
ncbi:MAG: division/cell wall cluster transcriptional repressor MraZ [Bacteroidetes bacterium]|jgi:MraZ protein|nr:division/cell wall cluster transcriptional repressor MraZ [Bacteroidota bacterium]MBU1421825.1 division/cell wall cluster transcriptional repressor MraZ [Bacteroidota bacterium]MBU2636339.1 division/cell wall cluster transcriptional repressor MraZ [Bacteroidota bacterium]MDI6779849.1 division/cell wall cluster transcriptional repressor MraZ [Bacteroidota bacterium]